MTGIYIHVPFCATRCSYCDFYTTTRGRQLQDRFTQALLAEIRQRPTADRISSVYLGGGTPSQLTAGNLSAIMEQLRMTYDLGQCTELTLEANPDDVDDNMAATIARLGFNRVSLGVQSLDDRLLQSVGRRHSAQQALAAIDRLHAACIDNISIDFIFGLPGQSLADWEADLRRALSLDVQHLSAYSLTYESGTPLFRQRERGEVQECDEEVSLAMFEMLIACTAEAGFEQYEISNFARPGRRAQHNASYWSGRPYIGLGPAAHSFDGHATRSYNLPDLQAYIDAAEGQQPFPTEVDTLTPDEQLNEVVMTRLRTKEGIDLEAFARRFGPAKCDLLLRSAQPYLQLGQLLLEPSPERRLHLSQSGIFISDHIIADLLQ